MSKARANLMQDLGIASVERPEGVAPRQFHEDFEIVATHYKLRELGEYDAAKQAARDNLESAITTYATLSNEVRTETT